MIIGQSASCGRGYDANLIPSNVKKGVGIYDVVGTFEGYVPQAEDIYYNGMWGDGWSPSNVFRAGNNIDGYPKSYSFSYPPTWSYDSLFIDHIATGNAIISYGTGYGFVQFNKQIIFPVGSVFELEVYNPDSSGIEVYLFFTRNLYNSSLGENYYNYISFDTQTSRYMDGFYLNGANVLSDGYTSIATHSVNGYQTKTISVTNSRVEFNGYVGIATSGSNSSSPLAIKRISLR